MNQNDTILATVAPQTLTEIALRLPHQCQIGQTATFSILRPGSEPLTGEMELQTSEDMATSRIVYYWAISGHRFPAPQPEVPEYLGPKNLLLPSTSQPSE